ncbi:MAG: hypothetical protein LBG30_06145 [Odoribacteraceae bacterium]|jgi:cell division protein FtsA|nr:hypothetical protein [Odoribacteraceae bacterium]
MNYMASLDMGSETMVMALAEISAGRVHVRAVEQVASEGIERGRVVNEKRAKAAVKRLLDAFREKHELNVDTLLVSLPANRMNRVTVNVPLTPCKRINATYLKKLEKQCMDEYATDAGWEPVVALPVSFLLDDKKTRRPLGEPVEEGEACYALYLAREDEIRRTRAWLATLGVKRVEFHAEVEAMGRALVADSEGVQDFALIDLGAGSTKVMVFQEGVAVRDVELPLGCREIDRDISASFSSSSNTGAAFSLPLNVAHRLKHEHGGALCATGKKTKIDIPNMKHRVDSQALLRAEQCRLEELLEGAMLQIKISGCYRTLADGILLTGGGSLAKDIDILLEKLSAHRTGWAVAAGMDVAAEEWLQTPGYLTALGLLACAPGQESLLQRVRNIFFP